MSFDFPSFFSKKAAWSLATFGPAQGVEGVIAHIRKELVELQLALSMRGGGSVAEELADICLLAIDLSWRAGGSAEDFGVVVGGSIRPADAALYISRHVESAPPPRALAVLVWDIAFRALERDAAPIEAKFEEIQTKRTWPDWRTLAPDQPIEHIRDEELNTEAVLAALTPAPPIVTSEVDQLRARVAELEAERAEWRADNERLRAERRKLRTWLQAQPHEGPLEAAARLCHEIVALRNGGGR